MDIGSASAVSDLLAHAGHWLETAAYALPPLTLIIALVVMAGIARRHAGPNDGSEVSE